MERDKDRQVNILSKLHSCNGDMQDLLEFLHTCGLSVRIFVIDYAGLSTNGNDVHLFVKQNRCLKELVVDNGHLFETMSRFDLIQQTQCLKKFKCRIAPVRRSS